MKTKTLSIVQLFGDCTKKSFKEDFRRLEYSFGFELKKIPKKEDLCLHLPDVPLRDSWRLRLLSEADEPLIDIKTGDDIGSKYNADELQQYSGGDIRLIYTIEKKKKDGVLSIYDYAQFVEYLQGLSVFEILEAIKNSLDDALLFEIIGSDYECFTTKTISANHKDNKAASPKETEVDRTRHENCGRYCQWATKLPTILPEDLHIIEKPKEGELAKMFDQLCLLLSVCYVADFSNVERDALIIRISGFKTLVSELDKVKVRDLAFDTVSVEQWFEIYDWCYTGGYTSDRLVIARNIISLNCTDSLSLKLNPSTLGAIKSNFRIFEQDNVRQYIKVRNDLSKDLLDLQDRINNIVEGFTGDFRKNVVGLGTFFLTLVVVRVVANGQWTGAFSTQIVALSFVFIALSVVLLVYSRLNLEKKEKLFTRHYDQLREWYKSLLSEEEAEKIFVDRNPKIVGAHTNYIQWQKKKYTWIWIGTLVAMSLFLIGVWCYNLFESTNLFKIIKAIVSCCTKNM